MSNVEGGGHVQHTHGAGFREACATAPGRDAAGGDTTRPSSSPDLGRSGGVWEWSTIGSGARAVQGQSMTMEHVTGMAATSALEAARTRESSLSSHPCGCDGSACRTM